MKPKLRSSVSRRARTSKRRVTVSHRCGAGRVGLPRGSHGRHLSAGRRPPSRQPAPRRECSRREVRTRSSRSESIARDVTGESQRQRSWGLTGIERGYETGMTDQSAEKPTQEWVTGDEPMTGPQASYLETLAREAGEVVSDGLTK